MYNLTNATCSDIYTNAALNVSCNYSGTAGATGPNGGLGSVSNNQGQGGTPFNAKIPVTAGQTYAINVSNYSLSTNGYQINFGASTAQIFDNKPPTITSAIPTTPCVANQLAIVFSENVKCSSIQPADFTVTGPGGPYTVTAFTSASCGAGATYGNTIILTVSPAMTTAGAYQFCLTNASGSVSDLCGNLMATPTCKAFNINAATVPVFNAIAPFCKGSVAPALQSVSNNGITGVWNPAIISNQVTATYTFTPDIGQCATIKTITVTVNN